VTYVCECIFKHEDPQNPGYSLTEHDLYPQVGPIGEAYSIRRNITDELYEIFDYQHNQAYTDQSVWYSNPELKHVAQEARDLETAATGRTKIQYGHHPDTLQCQLEWTEFQSRDIDNI